MIETNRKWQARWIWREGPHRAVSASTHELVYFRRTFEVPSGEPCRLVLAVSADSRYRLFLNGESVSVGPCKGDQGTYYFETVDVSEHLRPGKNVLAAIVMHYASSAPFLRGEGGPASVWRSPTGGLFLEGTLLSPADQEIEQLHTDERWRYLNDDAMQLLPEKYTLFAGPGEQVDGAQLPHGWEQTDYDDGQWQEAIPFANAIDLRTGGLTPWRLAPRIIPALFEHERLFAAVTRTSATLLAADISRLLASTAPLRLTAGKHVIELDAGELTTGYLRLALSGGKGSSIHIRCAECYEQEPVNGQRRKGMRDDTSGILVGDEDIYQVAGIASEVYEPFWFRTFRYVRLELEVGTEPLTLQSFSYRETGYPLEVRATFTCSDETLNPMWEISLRTLQRCMHESYEDCPFYEQLQYTMDTHLQMLFTYHVSGDDRLARKAMYDFHSSKLPSGILQSRYPSYHPQVIPGFALYWIFMVHDHYLYFGDEALVRAYLPTVDAVLGWFERLLTPEGLVGAAPPQYWSYVDWVPSWSVGVPPAGASGPLTVYSQMYATALEQSAVLNEALGRSHTARAYREQAERLNTALRHHCWSSERRLFRDGPDVELYSQHAQLWAVLAGTVRDNEAQELLTRMQADKSLAPVSYVMAFFLFRALEKAAMYDQVFPHWERWRRLVDLHITTWPETDENPRSECHAWSATPLYEFPAAILGVRPGAPGFARVIVEPRIGHLSHAQGTVITPHGPVAVAWQVSDDRTFSIQIEGPATIPIELRLPDHSTSVFSEGGSCDVRCTI